jgi:DNA-binding transcriptional regulator YhcF (GntR family)
MSRTRILFGKEIVSHHMLTYAEQIYDILVGEIELGRWKLNDRLPGAIQLAKELEFGTKTIQTAYDRLKREGYVKTLGYRGTYLKSQHPQPKRVQGRIGILISPEQAGQPLELWYEHVIQQCARQQNLVAEIKVLPGAMDVRQVNRKGVLFGEDTVGIISLTAFRMPARFGDGDEVLPLVFLCPPFEKCAPKVCADVREAYYDLTCRVIRYGHQRVVFSEDSIEPDPRQTQMHREGYLEAMEEHGLPVDMVLMEASRAVNNADLPSVVDHLKEVLRENPSQRPAAIVAGSLGRAMVIAKAAAVERIAIPQDLSVVSIGCAAIDEDHQRQITGMLPDFDRMAELCFNILNQQRQEGKSDFSKIHVRMHFMPGHSLRNLNGSEVKEISREVS